MSLTDAEIVAAITTLRHPEEQESILKSIQSDGEIICGLGDFRAIESAVLAKIATTPAASPIPIDAPALAQKLRELATGRVEWRVQDPVTKAFCMSFDYGDSINPKAAAQCWLAEFSAKFPDHRHAKYEIAEVRVFTYLEQAALQAADALAASTVAPQVDAPRWMPIETAPKDGTHVLLGRFTGKKGEHEGLRAVDWYRTDPYRHGFTGWGKFNAQFWPPTHWMPLPAAPVQVKGEA